MQRIDGTQTIAANGDDYDSPWKEAIERNFPEFLAFYFPEAHAGIDWSQEHVFLDKELQAVVQDAELGRRYVDKLVRVTATAGVETWIYIHIEVQGTPDTDFAERMFVYNYRLFDRYRKPIASLAVLADDAPAWKPASYGFEALGCRHRLDFPIAKLLDLADREDDLLAGSNPFALVTAAHLLTRATRDDMTARFAAKWKLVRLLYERGWERQQVLDPFAVIDWMMRLPADLDQQMWQDIVAFEEKAKMRYVTSVERLYIQQGLEQGLERGRQEGEARTLLRQLERRFGPVSSSVHERVTAAGLDVLDRWLDRVLDAPTLDAVFDEAHKH